PHAAHGHHPGPAPRPRPPEVRRRLPGRGTRPARRRPVRRDPRRYGRGIPSGPPGTPPTRLRAPSAVVVLQVDDEALVDRVGLVDLQAAVRAVVHRVDRERLLEGVGLGGLGVPHVRDEAVVVQPFVADHALVVWLSHRRLLPVRPNRRFPPYGPARSPVALPYRPCRRRKPHPQTYPQAILGGG